MAYINGKKVTFSAKVDIGATPSGTIEITENGTHDVSEYASANVNVSGGGGGANPLQLKCDRTKDLSYFLQGYPLESADDIFDGVDTGNVTCANRMFYYAEITTAPQLNTSGLLDSERMFEYCDELVSVPAYDFSKVTKSLYMFHYCRYIQSLPAYDFSNSERIDGMFDTCNRLEDASKITFSTKPTNAYYLFSDCEKLTGCPSLDLPNNESINCIFKNCKALKTIPLLNMLSTKHCSSAFSGCAALENLTLKNIKISLMIGSGTAYGSLLTVESLLNTIKELWNMTGDTAKTLTMGSTNLEKLANVYVKLIDITDDMRAEDEYIDNKLPFEVCESTDEGAMLLATDYMSLKNWEIK